MGKVEILNTKVGQYIRTRRQASMRKQLDGKAGQWVLKGMGQEEFTVALNEALKSAGVNLVVGRSTISNWENGYNMPPLLKPCFLDVLVKVLDTTVEDFMTATGYMVELTKGQITLTDRELELIRLFRTRQKESAIKLIFDLDGSR